MTPSDTTPDVADATPPPPFAPRGQRNQWIVIVLLSLAVVYVVYQQVDAQIAANSATSTAQDLAEPVDKLCRDDPNVRRQIGDDRCDQAAEVQRESTVAVAPRDGRDGTNGRDGRGIMSTAVIGGRLFVTYTDGAREDKGIIAVDGQNGRGITGARLDATGQLVLTYTDSTSETVGRIVGRDGERGRGIASVVVSADYHVIVTYTDGTIEDVGALPPGPPGSTGPTGATGPAGRSVLTVDFDMKNCTATVYYSDSTSETKEMTGCAEGNPTTSPPTTTTGGLPLPTN